MTATDIDIDYRVAKDAEAKLYAETKAAEAVTKKADASVYEAKKDAEAMIEKAKAYSHMAEVLGGPQGLLQYMMLERGTHEALANANAKAINGLEPKITVWNTGEGSSNSDDGIGAIRNIMQSLPPLFSTIKEQTGIAPPSWLAHMGQHQLEQAGNDKAKVNGSIVNGK